MSQGNERRDPKKPKKPLHPSFGCLFILLLLVAYAAGREVVGFLVRIGPERQVRREWAEFSFPENRAPAAALKERNAGDTAVFDGMEFVWCPPGSFSPQEPGLFGRAPVVTERTVTLDKGFWIGKYEVTKADWVRVMGTQPWRERIFLRYPGHCFDRRERHWWRTFGGTEGEGGRRWLLDLDRFWKKEPQYMKQGVYSPSTPATHITFSEVKQFIQRLNDGRPSVYRVPREHEWEYACGAGGPCDTGIPAKEQAWTVGEVEFAQPVGRKQPSPWGIFDMLGNVSEFVLDERTTLRGGAFRFFRAVPPPSVTPEYCCACLVELEPDGNLSTDYWGFRLLREVESDESGIGE